MDLKMQQLNTSAELARATFSSDDLPEHLDDRNRYALWRDLFTARYGHAFDLSTATGTPFSMRCDFTRFGRIHIGRFEGTIERFARTSRYADDDNDDFVLGLNAGATQMAFRQLGRDGVIDSGGAVLVTNTESGEIRCRADNQWYAIALPRRHILDLVSGAEDLVGISIDSGCEPLQHLRRYLGILLQTSTASPAALSEHISTALIDLVALSVETRAHANETAPLRGLRAVHLQDALSSIAGNFADPDFSHRQLARQMNLSVRYVQELLHGAGRNFTDRVTELRLQKARSMLSDPRHDRMKIGDIAYACGFHEASYFNRRFRARFGCSPTQYRTSGPDATRHSGSD
jgi:AraC-like DNA-binding protein